MVDWSFEMPALPQLPSGRGLTRRLLVSFAALDVVFRALVLPEVLLVTPGLGLRALLVAIVPCAAVSLAITAALLHPLRRWLDRRDTAGPAVVLAANLRARKLPELCALIYSASWWVPLLGVTLATGTMNVGIALFVCTAVFAPLPVTYIVSMRILSTTTQAVSVAAAASAIVVPRRAFTLRLRMLAFSLCIGIAPSMYMASIAFTAHRQDIATDQLLQMLLIFLLCVVLYTVICAVLFADALVRPIHQITEVASRIVTQGDVTRVARLPQEHDDEIGQLASWTNRMLDRLEQTEAARALAHDTLEGLNASLEKRVDDRTARLAEVNDALADEMQSRLEMEVELRQVNKLEAVGRLAAGVAHEINSPVQYVTDSVQFLKTANDEMGSMLVASRALRLSTAGCPACAEASANVRRIEEAVDADYYEEEVPLAIDRAIEGLERIAAIVRSMNKFAYADNAEMSCVDLNDAVQSTLVIANNELKYVADVVTDFGELPPVTCFGGEINQVVLNLVVNAAHAISDVVGKSGSRGKITVRTRSHGDHVMISIGDTGGGIPEAIRDRIFDPFFTTKEVGRGTGQGLAIARAVMQKHYGALEFESTVGVGTTFYLRLPLEADAKAA